MSSGFPDGSILYANTVHNETPRTDREDCVRNLNVITLTTTYQKQRTTHGLAAAHTSHLTMRNADQHNTSAATGFLDFMHTQTFQNHSLMPCCNPESVGS